MKKIWLANHVTIALSDVGDGDMRTIGKSGTELSEVKQNRVDFLSNIDLTPEKTALVMISYEDSGNFTRFSIADQTWRGRGMVNGRPVKVADAVATRERNLGLFLPLGDCVGAVIFDPERKVLMVAHLGRHSTEEYGASEAVRFMTTNFESDPKNLRIWLSPAAGAGNYPLYKFENRSLHDVNVAHFLDAGVDAKHIMGDDIDTTIDPNYFSHSNGDCERRFAIVAKMI